MLYPRVIGFASRCCSNNTGVIATTNHLLLLAPRTRSPSLLTGRRSPKIIPTAAPFSINHALCASRKQMPSRPKPPPETEIEESFLKGSGPGGQKIVCFLRVPLPLIHPNHSYPRPRSLHLFNTKRHVPPSPRFSPLRELLNTRVCRF